jgi:hypothetical protein
MQQALSLSKISSYFHPIKDALEETIAEDIPSDIEANMALLEQPTAIESEDHSKTIREAIVKLNHLSKIRDNERVESSLRGKEITLFNRIQCLCILRYLQMIVDETNNEMEASVAVAKIMFGNSSPKSYKAMQIRKYIQKT